MSKVARGLVTLGVLLSLLMASMESTVVGTAMPTIVSQLGGIEHYSWVFTAYLVTSTTTVPLFGKLSDLYGRRRVFLAAMAGFLAGSALCGMAGTMEQLIAARALQGLGAGGLMPLAFIIMGDLFTLEQRAKMQGLFSGVWGVSSIAGPLLGGFLVDHASWPWVFLVNLAPGVLAAGLVQFAWREPPHAEHREPRLDVLGALLLSAAVVALLLGLLEGGTALGGGLLLLAVVLAALLLGWERRHPEPVLPVGLFRDRIFSAGCLHGLLAGCAMFGSAAFIPLFVQGVQGRSATVAGTTLTPQMLGWVVASIVGSRLLLRVSYRALALLGTALLALGTLGLTQISADIPGPVLMLYVTLMGVGMGLSVPAFLLAVQSTVARRQLGTATSTLQFSRNMGGTLGVGSMGALLGLGLAQAIHALGGPARGVTVEQLMSPLRRATLEPSVLAALQGALAGSLRAAFMVSAGAAVLAVVAVLLAPHGRIAELAERAAPQAGE